MLYHDIVYSANKSDNEEKSAEFAAKRMKEINLSDDIFENCKSQILATKNHLSNSNSDTNYFIDADLSIFGQKEEVYKEYKEMFV